LENLDSHRLAHRHGDVIGGEGEILIPLRWFSWQRLFCEALPVEDLVP
jgi:hypothetical protein